VRHLIKNIGSFLRSPSVFLESNDLLVTLRSLHNKAMTEQNAIERTNVQWAWEFLRRNPDYRFFYDRWIHARSGEAEITSEEIYAIYLNLEKIGAWRSRYEPWVQAGIATGKKFIHTKTVSNEYFKGSYVEADLHFDPMNFMLNHWINPNIEPLPFAEGGAFVSFAALQPGIFRPLSAEFRAMRDLGLIDYFSDSYRQEQFQDESEHLDSISIGIEEDVAETMRLLMAPENLEDTELLHEPYSSPRIRIVNLRGWQTPPQKYLTMELEDPQEISEQLQANKLALFTREKNDNEHAPRAVVHKVLRVSTDRIETFDLNINLQFDLSRPLKEQVAAADEFLKQSRDSIPLPIRKKLTYGFPELEYVRRESYGELTKILDVYDSLKDESKSPHGLLSEVIRTVASDKTLRSTEPEYQRLMKAFGRAEMMRQIGYRSLAFK
jgi:hypothetical protein